MNRILTANLEEFVSQYSFSTEKDVDKFEYFAGYCYLAKYRPNDTVTREDLLSIHTGEGNDWGIDNIIILINDHLVINKEDFNEFLKYNSSLRVKIILVQAKTSSSISVAELGNFLKGSRDILKYINGERDHLPAANQKLKDKLEILDRIYEKAAQFDRDGNFNRPRLHLYYVTGGGTKNNTDVDSAIADNKRSLESFNLVDDIQTEIITATEICDLYQSTKRRLTCELLVEHKMNLPEVEEIGESFLCLIPFSEFKKLIIDEDGNLIKSIFEDNVRDFQGDNRVNKAIGETIRAGKISLFTALNNGLTIIARKVVPNKKNLYLEDYQIVNGCQTCHVLYESRNVENIDNLVLMAKIIASEDREIRDSIVVANNNQTEVKREQLTSLLDAQRNIENYYKVQNSFTKLYYERRSKQYNYGNENIPADHVITIPYQIRAYVSMIMGQPHLTSNYYGKIIEIVNEKNGKEVMFDKNSNPAFYYMSALAAFKRDKWLGEGKIERIYKFVKHHLLYAIMLVLEKNMPQVNSNKAEEFCEDVCAILDDEVRGVELFHKAAILITQTLGRMPEETDLNDPTLASKIKAQWRKNKYTGSNNDVADRKQETTNTDKPKVSAVFKIDVPEVKMPKVIGKIDLSKLDSGDKSKRTRGFKH